jgi:hypothetical protein
MNGYAPAPEQTAITQLAAALDKLPARDRSFAQSLIDQAKSRRGLSERQAPWVTTLLERASGPSPTAVIAPEVLELEKTFSKLPVKDHSFALDLVRSCKAGHATPGRLKWVNTLLERAKAAEQKSARRVVLERVATKVGLKADTIDRVVRRLEEHVKGRSEEEFLAALEADGKGGLAAMAKQYGDATHNCCFCGLDLTDERSTSAGYGPICAGKYGLPWGEVPAIEKQEG